MKCPFVIKVCNKCKRILVAYNNNFHKAKECKHGLSNTCKECASKRKKEYYKENNEYIKERVKTYYENNKEYYKKYKRRYYEENKEKINKKNMEYYKDNKEEMLKIFKKYRENNKDKISKSKKEWYKNNPQKTFNTSARRRFKEENQGAGFTKEQWYEMMEFFDWRCAYSGEYIGGDSEFRTIDHIISLNKGGKHEIWNCVPMHKTYNSSKYINDMISWYKQQEFFDIDRLMKIYEWQEYAFEKYYLDNSNN